MGAAWLLLLDLVELFSRYAFARIVDGDDESSADVVVACLHHTALGVLGCVGGYLGDGVSQIACIDVNGQLLVGILDDVAGFCVLVFHPAGGALLFEYLCEVARLFLDIHHSGLQSRQVEYVVDKVEQVVGILRYAHAQLFLIVGGGFLSDLGYIFHHGVHRRLDVLDHVLHEAVLGVLHLLHLGCLYSHLPLDVHQLADVAQESEIFLDASVFVVIGLQLEIERERAAALGSQGCLDAVLYHFVGAVVHIRQQSHGCTF